MNMRTIHRVVCVWVLLFAAASAQAQFTITPVSSPVFYIDTGITPQLKGMYAAYRITNSGGSTNADVWVGVDTFAGGIVSLAPNEDGIVRLGPLAPGQTKLACFYLQASGPTATAQSHTIKVYTSQPPGAAAASQSFSFTAVEETIKANANKVNVVVTTPNPPTLGGVVTITVTGDTGTIGADRILAYTPATYLNWRPDALQLVNTTITLTRGNSGVYNDTLYIITPNTPDTTYVAQYIFRIVSLTGISVPVSPVGFISSGTQIKHTDTGGFIDLLPVEPAENKLTLTKNANTNQVGATGILTFSIAVSNSSTSNDVALTDLVDTLPTTPGTVSYVNNSSQFNGSSIPNPTITGSTLKWFGPLTIPAGQTRSLTFQAQFPVAVGSYTNSAVGHVDTTQIDTTLTTTDDSPATKVVTVYPVSDLGVVKTGATNVNAGTQLIYTITVTNNGPSVATNIVVQDTLPVGVIFAGASNSGTTNSLGQVVWPVISSLASNAGVSYTITNAVPPGGVLTNIATATCPILDPNGGNNTGTVFSTITPIADLSILKTPSASPVLATNQFTYTVTVSNAGPSTATSLVVTDSLPADVQFIQATPTATTNASNQVIWSLPGGLSANGVTNLTLVVKAPA